MISSPKETLRGLVLLSSPYQEDSAVITLATPQGVLSLMARGVYRPKSPLKPLLLAFSLVEVEYHQSGEASVRQASYAKALFDSSTLYTSYPDSIFLGLLQELSLDLYREGEDYPLEEVSLLLEGLAHQSDRLSLALLLLGVFYRSLGLKEDTQGCYVCGKKKPLVSYSLEGGGFLCPVDALANGIAPKDPLDLYVLKFAFLPIDATSLSKKVPTKQGKDVFEEMLANLLNYFDLKQIASLPLFLEIV